ncbi:5-methyltetrahydropteroyltriglutamate--homocysteine methyltransferase [Nitrosomonas communis]|uniref:5-methyltetrahydropteroyltriglutamate--homocysteine methyltransferase n=1 Tax=Nitrosomonas communis TaxID=44574 RepID=A0A5D3YBR4_9PROT|nr:5-methyltetrahydropteroyltriglutamate--homocysteine methyltransferase [Nitrosomonas communis]
MDEPCLAFELEAIWLEKLSEVYTILHGSGCQLLLTTYFDAIDKHAATLKALPVEGLHIDVCRAPHQLDVFLPDYPTNKVLSLGIIDGRNVWRADLSQAFATLSKSKA